MSNHPQYKRVFVIFRELGHTDQHSPAQPFQGTRWLDDLHDLNQVKRHVGEKCCQFFLNYFWCWRDPRVAEGRAFLWECEAVACSLCLDTPHFSTHVPSNIFFENEKLSIACWRASISWRIGVVINRNPGEEDNIFHLRFSFRCFYSKLCQYGMGGEFEPANSWSTVKCSNRAQVVIKLKTTLFSFFICFNCSNALIPIKDIKE